MAIDGYPRRRPVSRRAARTALAPSSIPGSCSLHISRRAPCLRQQVLERDVAVGEAPSIDRRRARMIAWICSMTSQTLTFMPRHDALVAMPERDELALSGSPRKTTSSHAVRVADVLHPQVVLVGEEVRQAVVELVVAEHVAGGRGPWLSALAQCSTRMRAVERVPGVGDVARGEDAGALVCRCSSTRTPLSTSSPAALASSVRGCDADADDDEVASSAPVGECDPARPCRRPRSPRHRVPSRNATPWSAWRSRYTRAELGAEHALERDRGGSRGP